MLIEKITYVDYNGEERTEEFMFNLSKAEVAEMEMSTAGGLAKKLEQMVAAKDGALIIQTFKDLILKAYGVKSPDGKRFVKSQELRDEFAQTEAYSELFIKLATDAEAASAFVNGIVPKVAK